MPATVEIFSSAIIAVGTFTPAFFSPDLFESHGLIGPEDAVAARESEGFVVSKQVSQFQTSWFQFQALENQLNFASKGVLTPSLRDVTVGIFSLGIPVSVTAVGLNFMGHYKFTDVAELHQLGDTLAPKKGIWDTIFPDENQSIGLLDLRVRIRPGKREETPKTQHHKQIIVQPSGQIKNGVFLAYNDHHPIQVPKDDKKTTSLDLSAKVISENWESSWKEAEKVFAGILEHRLRK